jgi:MFS transporter, ACS family, tartrate transporter
MQLNNTAEKSMESKLEAHVIRKVTMRIIPFVMLLYFMSFLDRVNVGFAALSMNKAIGLTPAMFGFGGSLFHVGYLLFGIPSNLVLSKVGARVWIARVMVAWGIVSVAFVFVSGPTGFYVLRFLLGIAEAGFFPGIILYLGFWFPARQRAWAIALFMAAAPISGVIGSVLSGLLMEVPHVAGLSNWQWLFIAEGAPTVILGFLVLVVLADGPEKAAWLAPDERGWLMTRLASEHAEAHRNPSHVGGALRALADPRVLILGLVYMGVSTGSSTLALWGPTIIKQYGFPPLEIGILNGIPNIAAVIGMILWARHSDRTKERTWHVVIPCLIACSGMILGANLPTALGVVLALVLVNTGTGSAKPPLWAMPSLFLSGSAAAAGVAAINAIAGLGTSVGPFAIGWFKSHTGSYEGGLYVLAALLVISTLGPLLIRQSRPREVSRAQV